VGDEGKAAWSMGLTSPGGFAYLNHRRLCPPAASHRLEVEETDACFIVLDDNGAR
jgi:hypothetical protein